jgi:hypothetical protein
MRVRRVRRVSMSSPDLCPAILHGRPEERVICIHAPQAPPPGAFGFICRRCFEAMLKGADDREAIRRERDTS